MTTTKRILTLAVLALLVFPTAAAHAVGTSTTAVATAVTSDEAFSLLGMMAKAFHSHSWMLLSSGALMLLVVCARRFNLMKKVPPAYVPWVTLGMASAVSIAVGLKAGMPLGSVLTTGLLVGMAAIGGWESFAKLARGLLSKGE